MNVTDILNEEEKPRLNAILQRTAKDYENHKDLKGSAEFLLGYYDPKNVSKTRTSLNRYLKQDDLDKKDENIRKIIIAALDRLRKENPYSPAKEYENKMKGEYSKKSSIENPKEKLTRKESGFTFEGKMSEMTKGIFNSSSFIDYLLHNKEVNLLKTDMKIKTKPVGIGSGRKKPVSLIEVKYGKPNSLFKVGEISSIRTNKQWTDYLAGTKRISEKMLKKKLGEEEVLKIAKFNFDKMIESVLKETPQKKNALINRMLTHLTPENANSFLHIGNEKGKKVVPFSKKYIDFFVEKGGKYAPYKGAGVQLPRVNIMAKLKPGVKFTGPVVENLLDFTKELLNGET